MLKPKAIFLGDGPIFEVYDKQTIARLNERFAFLSGDETRAAEYIFSTWGMPALSEEDIKTRFPALKAVFYAAGSVQGFARPLLRGGVRVFSAWAANAIPVVEFTAAQIVLANKGYFQGLRRQQAEGRAAFSKYTAGQPGNYHVPVGIIGAGMIGKFLIQLLQPYNFELWVHDP